MSMMKCRHVSTAAAVVIGVVSVVGCATTSSQPSKPMSSSSDRPADRTADRPAAVLKPRPSTIESEKRLLLCGQEGSCDRLHFMTALSTLHTNSDAAVAHFREVIRTAPKSTAANLSRSWLNVLGTSSRLEEKQVITDTIDWLLLELLNRDKQVEELSKQLNALKSVDLEMKERTSRMKPRITPLPTLESGQ
ncbi:hypothetical protein [Nitrospira sp. Nam74]